MSQNTVAQPGAKKSNIEKYLLLLSGVFLFANFLALGLQREPSLQHWLPFLAWIVCAGGGYFALQRMLP
ncbi:MAG: hypothetical protein ACPG7F_22305, partial [Aggregatilineales bacterium]